MSMIVMRANDELAKHKVDFSNKDIFRKIKIISCGDQYILCIRICLRLSTNQSKFKSSTRLAVKTECRK